MNLVIFAVLVFGHLVVASNEPPISSAKEVIGDIISVMKGALGASPHIVGGGEAERQAHPHQAAIMFQNAKNQSSFCGGSLISPEWVLTAGHCTVGVKRMKVVLGAHKMNESEPKRQVFQVKKFVRHRLNLISGLADNIALVKLSTPALLNKYVQTIRLPSLASKTRSLTDIPIKITGWGMLSDSKRELSPSLQEANSTVISNKDCSSQLRVPIKKTMICADGSKGQSICNGDTGGPMVMTESDEENTLIGIGSFISGNGCEKGFPCAFTRVDQYLEWIHQNTGLPLRKN